MLLYKLQVTSRSYKYQVTRFLQQGYLGYAPLRCRVRDSPFSWGHFDKTKSAKVTDALFASDPVGILRRESRLEAPPPVIVVRDGAHKHRMASACLMNIKGGQTPQSTTAAPSIVGSVASPHTSFGTRSRSRRSAVRTSIPLLASATAIATPKKSVKSWKLRLPFICNAAAIVALLLLDMQDLFYKLIWVGPAESFSFRTTVTGVMRDSVLAPKDPSFNIPGRIDVDAHASSWPHFLSSCENLTAFDNGAGFFAIASGSNCTIGQGGDRRTLDRMIVSSAVRLDSIVWTVCKLLYQSQQPFICRAPIVTKFLHRYMFRDTAVDISSLAAPGSTAEKELLTFLDMVSKSYPFHKMVCVEGFEWTDGSLGTYVANIHGCASPNLMRSEFIGLSNPSFHQLHRDRVWLTADVFHWFGLRFGIRQNNRNVYYVERNEDGTIRAAGHTTPNFTCFGPLYSVMIALDVLLLMVNVRTSWELVDKVLIPRSNELVRRHRRPHREILKVIPRTARRRFAQAELRRRPAETQIFQPSVKLSPRSNFTLTLIQPSWVPVEHLDLKELESMLPCTVHRSWLFIVATVVSQLLSWMIIVPNSVVWVWGLSTTTKIQAFLSSLRVWVLLVVACNFIWDCVVAINEEWAYYVSSRTFLTPLEIIVVGGIMAAWKMLDIFLMCERKWAIENQRVNDVSAFVGGFVAHGNTYQPSVEILFSTPMEIIAILYGPLLHIIGASILWLAVYLAVKGFILSRFQPPLKAENLLSPEQLVQQPGKYKRLPMEEEADCPIRAKSLVRMHMEMEHTHHSQRYILPYCYLECGILPREARITTRAGFTNFLPLKYEKRARMLQAKAWEAD